MIYLQFFVHGVNRGIKFIHGQAKGLLRTYMWERRGIVFFSFLSFSCRYCFYSPFIHILPLSLSLSVFCFSHHTAFFPPSTIAVRKYAPSSIPSFNVYIMVLRHALHIGARWRG